LYRSTEKFTKNERNDEIITNAIFNMFPGQEKTFLSLNSVPRLSLFFVTFTEYLDWITFKWFTTAQFGTKARYYLNILEKFKESSLMNFYNY